MPGVSLMVCVASLFSVRLLLQIISKSELEIRSRHCKHFLSLIKLFKFILIQLYYFIGNISKHVQLSKHTFRAAWQFGFAQFTIITNNSQFRFSHFSRSLISWEKIAITQMNRETCLRWYFLLKFQQIIGRDEYRDHNDRGKTLPRWQVSLTTVTLSHCTAPGQEDPQSELPLDWASRPAT